MRSQRAAGFAEIALLALGIVLLPITTWSQSGAPAAPPALASVHPGDQAGCDVDDTWAATQGRLAASIDRAQREMARELRGLKERFARGEGAMKDDQLAKLADLRASMGSQKAAELSAQAEEVASRAQELAQEAPRALIIDDESGWLGVEIAEVSTDKAKELKLPATRGVAVIDVESDSPAAKAGLKSNDVITEYDRQQVEGTVQFHRLVRETPPGRTIPLSVWREGRAQNLSVEIGDRSSANEGFMRHFAPPNFDFHFDMPDFEGWMGPMNAPTLGIGAEDLNGQLGEYFGAPNGEGVLVRDVRPGTPAEKAGLKAGDVITKVDAKPVKSVSELREQLREKRDQKTISLGIIRKGSEMGVNVSIERPRPIEHPHISRRISL